MVEKSGFLEYFLVNSGAEANEVALKMARLYRKKGNMVGAINLFPFIALFTEEPLLTLALTAQEKFHQDLDPLPPGIEYATLNDLQSVEKSFR